MVIDSDGQETYQEYSFGFHYDNKADFRAEPLKSKWVEDTNAVWIQRRAQINGGVVPMNP